MKIKYQNEHIQKQVKENSIFFEFIVVAVISSIAMISASFFRTYIDRQKHEHLPFDELMVTRKVHDHIYYGDVYGEPEKLADGYYGVRMDDYYFVLHVGDSYMRNKILREIESNNSSEIHGHVVRLNYEENRKTCNAMAEYYNKNNNPVYITDNMYLYLEVLDGSLVGETTKAHPLGLVFGITGFILEAMMIYWSGTLNMIKHLRPACGSKRYTPEQIDEQANMPESVWLGGLGIYLAPKIMIGIRNGVTAVEYGDIARIKITSGPHLEKSKNSRGRDEDYRISVSYQLIVITKRWKRLKFSDTWYGSGTDYNEIFRLAREHNPDVVIKEIKEGK